MLRKSLVSAVFLASLLSIPALSNAADMPPPPAARPMMPHPHGMRGWHGPKMMAKAPVPMLMPIVWRHAEELQLTPSQEKQLKTWREEQKSHWQSQRTVMEQHNRALREALLRGESGAALQPLEQAVVQDHEAMLQRGIAQVEFLHKLLNAEQWQKVTGIYAKMSHWRPAKEGWHKP